jgi:hypothetical protein
MADNPKNILGYDNSNNMYASTNVAANADGSIIERIEYLQTAVAAIGVDPGLVTFGVAAAGTNSTTEIAIAALAGYGDDFFNHEYYMQVIKNANSATNAPEKEVRQITDYVSATGTFACTAFSAAVEASDVCLILHESLVMLGRNDSNNTFDSSAVAANVDGSILERLEDLVVKVTAVDDLVDTEVAAIKTETDKIAGFIAGGGIGSGIARKTVTFANATVDIPLFTVTGDVIVRLVAVCGTNVASAGGANIGVDAGAVALIADTDCTAIDAGEIWHDTSPDASVEATSVLKEYIIANGTDITLDIETEKQVDSGVINFYCIYTPLSSTGAVAAA